MVEGIECGLGEACKHMSMQANLPDMPTRFLLVNYLTRHPVDGGISGCEGDETMT